MKALDDDRRSFLFNRIYVIESLRGNDTLTGKDLFKDLLTRETYRHTNLSTDYTYCKTKKDLIVQLNKVKKQSACGNILPLIHFEVHGNKKGIVLESSEKMEWDELLGYLIEINIDTKNNLLVSFATCYAFSIYAHISVIGRAPFFGFVSSPVEISEEEISSGFYEFFKNIINGTDFLVAFDALNANCNEGSKFVFEYGEKILNRVFDAYDEGLNIPSVYVQKLLLHTEMFYNNPELKSKGNLFEAIAYAKYILSPERRKELRKEAKNKFLMFDLK